MYKCEYFPIHQFLHVFWALNRIISLRWFFCEPETCVLVEKQFFFLFMQSYLRAWCKWVSTRQNLSLRFQAKRDSNQIIQLQRLARKFGSSLVASLDIILSYKRITKALIKTHGCAGWARLHLWCSQTIVDTFSHVEVHIHVLEHTCMLLS